MRIVLSSPAVMRRRWTGSTTSRRMSAPCISVSMRRIGAEGGSPAPQGCARKSAADSATPCAAHAASRFIDKAGTALLAGLGAPRGGLHKLERALREILAVGMRGDPAGERH